MIRDFSENAKNDLYDAVDRVAPQNGWESVADFFSDTDYTVKRWIGELNIEKYLNNVDKYHEMILDQKNYTKKDIDKIFDDVRKVEDKYSNQLEIMNEHLDNYRKKFKDIAEIMNPSHLNSIDFKLNKLESILSKIDRTDFYLEMIMSGSEINVSEEVRALLEERLTKMQQNRYCGKKSVDKMLLKDIKELVALFEYLNPEKAIDANNMYISGKYNQLTEEDIRNMKYIAYTAPEPYRTAYFRYINAYSIGRLDGNYLINDMYLDPLTDDEYVKAVSKYEGTYWLVAKGIKLFDKEINSYKSAHYQSTFRKIFFVDSLSSFGQCAQGPYVTFFHESGHAMDSSVMDYGGYYSCYFKTYNQEMGREVTLQEAIYYDVYKNIEDKIRTQTTNEADVAAILESFKYGSDVSGLTQKQLYTRNDVIKMYNKGGIDDLNGEKNEAAADVYGGVTNLVINVGYGHRPTADNGERLTDQSYLDKVEEYRYWYDSKGNATYAQSKELLAEYFSYYMTGTQDSIQSMRDHFPQASLVLDEMFKSEEYKDNRNEENN